MSFSSTKIKLEGYSDEQKRSAWNEFLFARGPYELIINYELSADFINENWQVFIGHVADIIFWQELDQAFWEKHWDFIVDTGKVASVFACQNISFEFIEEHWCELGERFDSKQAVINNRRVQLTNDFILKHWKELLSWELFECYKFEPDFLAEHMDDIISEGLMHAIAFEQPLTQELIVRYIDHFNKGALLENEYIDESIKEWLRVYYVLIG